MATHTEDNIYIKHCKSDASKKVKSSDDHLADQNIYQIFRLDLLTFVPVQQTIQNSYPGSRPTKRNEWRAKKNANELVLPSCRHVWYRRPNILIWIVHLKPAKYSLFYCYCFFIIWNINFQEYMCSLVHWAKNVMMPMILTSVPICTTTVYYEKTKFELKIWKKKQMYIPWNSLLFVS